MIGIVMVQITPTKRQKCLGIKEKTNVTSERKESSCQHESEIYEKSVMNEENQKKVRARREIHICYRDVKRRKTILGYIHSTGGNL